RDVVHAPRRGRGGLALRHADPGPLGAQPGALPAGVPCRHVGASGGGPDDRGGRPPLEGPMSAPADKPELGKPLPLAEVEKELNRQLAALKGPGVAPVQWARMSNLVIYC